MCGKFSADWTKWWIFWCFEFSILMRIFGKDFSKNFLRIPMKNLVKKKDLWEIQKMVMGVAGITGFLGFLKISVIFDRISDWLENSGNFGEFRQISWNFRKFLTTIHLNTSVISELPPFLWLIKFLFIWVNSTKFHKISESSNPFLPSLISELPPPKV